MLSAEKSKQKSTVHLLTVLMLHMGIGCFLWASCTSTPTAAKGTKNKASASSAAGAPKSAGGTAQVKVASLPRLTGVHHAVYDLTDNRMAAHMVRSDGLFIPVGYPGSAKYMSFARPWRTFRLRYKHEGKRVALATRPVSWLTFPLTAEQAKQATTLTVSLFSPRGQGLRVKLNKKKLETSKLSRGWQKVSISVPTSTARAGENKLELRWGTTGRVGAVKASAAVAWVHLGAGSGLADPGPTEPLHSGQLYLPVGGGLAYYVYPYAGAKLRLLFAAQAAAQRCSVKVHGQAADATLSQTLTETNLAPGKKVETYVDLKLLAGKVARLQLTAQGSGCQGLALAAASIVMPGPASVVKRGAPPQNVLFWMIDNARADRYSFYNPKTRVKTPVLSELARTGTVFSRAYIQGTESRVSHASIWTGLYPRQHRFVSPKSKLSLNWQVLPEGARKAGLYTAAWIANGFVSKFWGFAQGFNSFRNTLHKGGGLNAEALAGHAIKFIEKKGGQRFYLYVGTIDPHVSWRGRQPWLKQYHPEPYSGLYKKNVWGKDVEKMAIGARKVSTADRKRIRAIYDSTVSYNDHHLGRVIEALKKKGIRDQTMIVVTADHGEELWDYGKVGHGGSCREEVVAVPLLIHYPPLFGKGVRVTEGVDVASVLPSVMDALGTPADDRVQAESLLPLAHGVGRGYPRPSFASQYELAHTMRLEQWKVWVGGKGVPRLYDMTTKHRPEKKDVAAARPRETRWMTDALSTFLFYQARWRVGRWGVSSNHKAALPRDLEGTSAPPKIRP